MCNYWDSETASPSSIWCKVFQTRIYNITALLQSLREHWNAPVVCWHFTGPMDLDSGSIHDSAESSIGNIIINRSGIILKKGRVRITIITELQSRLWSLRYGLKSRITFSVWNNKLSRSFGSHLQNCVLTSHSKIERFCTVAFYIPIPFLNSKWI